MRKLLLAPLALAAAALAFLPAAPASAAPGQVTTLFNQFWSPVTVLPAGSTLDHTNADFLLHSVQALHFSGTTRLFESANAGFGQTKPVNGVSSLAPGSYNYRCGVHFGMRGTLVIV